MITGMALTAIWAWNARSFLVAIIGGGIIGYVCSAIGLP